MGATLYTGDAIEVLERCMPTESVRCIVTSPPYWGLRDYGTASWRGGDPACDHRKSEFRRGRLAGKTKGGLLAYQLLPADMPEPAPPAGEFAL